MRATQIVFWAVFALVWLTLIINTLRYRQKAWAHRTALGREFLRWDRPRFRWLVIPDTGRREHFDDAGWRYRRRMFWYFFGTVASMVAAGFLAPFA
jgi:hypothetical protein